MKYKVGDVVRLVNTDEMSEEWRGKSVTISAVNTLGRFYRIEEDGGQCIWYESDIEYLEASAAEKIQGNESTHPTHYQGGVEPIDLIEAQQLSFNRGNVVKYVCRAGRKDNELEDLKKAEFYLKREIDRLERVQTNETD